MSIELLTVEKSEQKTESKSSIGKTESKKDTPSLFDSLMKDVKKDIEKTTKTIEKSTDKIETKPSSSDTKIEIKKSTKNPIGKMVDNLVEIVVDEVKNKSTKDSNTQSKILKQNTQLKKQSLKTDDSKPIAKSDTKVVSEIKKIVDQKTDIIKDAASDIKINIAKVVDTVDEKNNLKEKNSTKDKIKNSNITAIKKVVDQKADNITDAVVEIKSKVSKAIEILGDKNSIKENNDIEDKDLILKIEDNPNSKKQSVKTATLEATTKIGQVLEINTVVNKKVENIKDSVSDIKINIDKVVDKIELTDKKVVLKDKVEEKTTGTIGDIKEIIIVKTTVIESAVKDIEIVINNLDIITTNRSDDTKNNNLKVDAKASLMATMFQSNQQKTKEKVSMSQVVDAKKNIEKNKTMEAVKKSAKMLDLDADNLELNIEKNIKTKPVTNSVTQDNNKANILNLTQSRSLNKIIIDKQVKQRITLQNDEDTAIEVKATTAKQVEAKVKELNVSVNVPQNVVETIQNKIIGAQQKVGNFMSEVARNMYLNYKPPLTAFKMNLNPANLGSISIVMKANKADSSISVNMNMSNSSTMETFAENKLALQNALQKQLGENSNISLNFNMQDSNSNNSFNQSGDNSSQKRDTTLKQDDTHTDIEESEVVENLDYM